MNLIIRMEEIALKKGALNLTILTLVASCLLVFFGSPIAGVNYLLDKRFTPPKQVGFIFAPNWLVIYVLLFPLFVATFCLLVGKCREALMSFTEDGTITAEDGKAMDVDTLKGNWEQKLNRASFALKAMFLGIVALAIEEWWVRSFWPIWSRKLPESIPLDWSSFAAKYPDQVHPIANYVFSAVAYAYMASALFVFVAVFVYGAAYCGLFYEISQRADFLRLVYRNTNFPKRLSEILIFVFICSVLGLMAAYCMRLQAVFMASDIPFITDLIFAKDFWRLQAQFEHSSSQLSWGVVFYSILLLLFCVFLLRDAFNRARDYFLEKVTRQDWRESHGVTWDDDFIDGIRDARFYKSVIPSAYVLGAILALGVVCHAFIGWGVFGVAMLIMIGTQAYMATRISIPSREKTIAPGPSTRIQPIKPVKLEMMSTKNVERLAAILANFSINNGGPVYFRQLIQAAEIPQHYKWQRQEGWTGQALYNARDLITWADALGATPDGKYTILGAILQPQLIYMGDRAPEVVAIMVVEKLVREPATMAEFKRLNQFPDIAHAAPGESSSGPEFAVNMDDLALQGFFTPEPDYQDVGFLKNAIARAATVCLIDVPGVGKGTGVLIDYDKVLTNYHVLVPGPDADLAERARDATACFGVISGQIGTTVDIKIDANDPVLASSPVNALDFVLLKLRKVEGFAVPPVPFITTAPRQKTALNLLHHPEGGEMKLSLSGNGVFLSDPVSGKLQYITKASRGSSGSPCFNDDWELVGIHHAERARPFGSIREGILMGSIYQIIKGKIVSRPN